MYRAGNQEKEEGEGGSKQNGQERDNEGRAENKRENKIVMKEPAEDGEK